MQERRHTDAEILAQLAVIAARAEATHNRTVRLVQLLEGNGGVGLKIRVDRLEQAAKRQTGYHAIWLSSAVAALFAWFQGWFRG